MSKPESFKTKVLIIALPLDNQKAGVHVYTKELIKAINNNLNTKIEFTIIRSRQDNEYPNLKSIILPDLFWVPGWSSFVLFILIPIITLLSKIDISIEPAHFGPFNLPNRIKRVTVIHDLTPIIFPQYHRFIGRVLQKIYLKKILSKADLILSNSQNTQVDLEKYYPKTKGKIKTIYLGLSSIYKLLKADDQHLKKLNIKKPYLLFVGTIEPRKNLELLLDTFNYLKSNHDFKYSLNIVGGKGWNSDSFYSKLENHPYKNKIRLLGFVDKEELVTLYSNASLFIYPSLYEGFGFPPLEAIYCGAKTVIPYNSSLKEIGKDLAFFYHDQTVASLSSTILSALKSNFDHIRSKQIIDHRFNWAKHTDTLQKILLNLFDD